MDSIKTVSFHGANFAIRPTVGTCCAANDGKVGIMMILGFPWNDFWCSNFPFETLYFFLCPFDECVLEMCISDCSFRYYMYIAKDIVTKYNLYFTVVSYRKQIPWIVHTVRVYVMVEQLEIILPLCFKVSSLERGQLYEFSRKHSYVYIVCFVSRQWERRRLLVIVVMKNTNML